MTACNTVLDHYSAMGHGTVRSVLSWTKQTFKHILNLLDVFINVPFRSWFKGVLSQLKKTTSGVEIRYEIKTVSRSGLASSGGGTVIACHVHYQWRWMRACHQGMYIWIDIIHPLVCLFVEAAAECLTYVRLPLNQFYINWLWRLNVRWLD